MYKRALSGLLAINLIFLIGVLSLCRMEEIVAALGGLEGAWNQIHTYQKRAEDILEALPSSDISLQLGKIVRKLGAV